MPMAPGAMGARRPRSTRANSAPAAFLRGPLVAANRGPLPCCLPGTRVYRPPPWATCSRRRTLRVKRVQPGLGGGPAARWCGVRGCAGPDPDLGGAAGGAVPGWRCGAARPVVKAGRGGARRPSGGHPAPVPGPAGTCRDLPGPADAVCQAVSHLRGRSSVGRALAWHARGSWVRFPSPPPKTVQVRRGVRRTGREPPDVS